MIQRKLLVLGCARGGTRYTNQILRHAGLDVRHEGMGGDGSVTSFFVTDMEKNREAHQGVRSDYDFEHIWHLVRFPLNWIRSAHSHMGGGYWKNVGKQTGIEVPVGETKRPHEAWVEIARHWLVWNRFIEDQKPELRMRLEEMESFWPTMMSLLGIDKPFPIGVPAVGHNISQLQRTPEITWDMIAPVADEVRAMATQYGYEVD